MKERHLYAPAALRRLRRALSAPLRPLGFTALIILALAGPLALSGCDAPQKEETPVEYAPSGDRTLVIYTSHKEEVYRPIVEEFEERTGIWVDVVSGGTGELLKRISQETDAPQADVMFGGGVDSLTAYAECFSPYSCQDWDMLQAEYRSQDGLWTPFSSLPAVLIYNTKLVEAGQVTAWSDLFSPAWHGRIAFCDPGISGSSFTSLVTLLSVLENEDETSGHSILKALAENLDGRQYQSSGQVLDAVADGTDLIGVTLEETALKRIAAGEDIAIVYPADGTCSVPDGAALIKGAAHRENAGRFLDFISGRDVQSLLEKQFCRRTVRTDILPAGILPKAEELPLADYDIEKAGREHDAILMSWAFYQMGEDSRLYRR